MYSCSVAFNKSKVISDQVQQRYPHSDLKHPCIASASRVATDTSSPQASYDIPQASPDARHLRGSSHSNSERPSHLVLQTPGIKIPTPYSMTNNLEPAYFATSSWSFPKTAAAYAGPTATPSKPDLKSPMNSRFGRSESSRVTMIDRKASLKTPSSPLLQQPMITDLTDDDDALDEEDLARWMAHDAEDERRRSSLANTKSKEATSWRSSIVIQRNLPIASPLVSLTTFTHKNIILAEKVYVELQDGDFLRIVHIIQDTSSSAVTLRGWKFRRTREMNGVLEKKRNEVCWILHVDEDDPRDAKLQGMETVSVCEVVKRRHIRLTNQSFPALSWREDDTNEMPEIVENDRVLVCRFKYICVYADAKARALYAWCEKGLYRLREHECDQRSDNKLADENLRSIWRGDTVPGGAQKGWLPGEKEFLRQEKLSHEGVISRSSLKAPSGQLFPIGDPMKRGSVGFLLMEQDLQRSSDQARQGDFNTDEGYNVSVWRRGFRKSSIQCERSRNKAPRVIEIDAQVKTTSSSGTFEERYEAKLTSRYYSSPRLPHKRPAGTSSVPLARPMKRVDQGIRVESGDEILRHEYNGQACQTLRGRYKYTQREPIPSDSDGTLGRSQSPDSVEEMHSPLKSRSHKNFSGLSTPLLRGKDSVSRRSRDAIQTPGMGRIAGCNQRSKPLSGTAGSSAVQTEVHGFTENDDCVIDLTRPQGPTRGSLPWARPSVSWQPSPSLYARSVLPTNPRKISSSNEKPTCPISASSPFESKSHLACHSSHSILPEPLPTNSGSSQSFRALSHRTSNAISDPSLRCTEESSKQMQSTIVRKSTPKANGQRYTFGDCFSGVGGMSRGAVSAGLRVKWAFDFNPTACQAYALNFFGTPVYNVWADQFSKSTGDHKCDICHLSPPCQFFSDAHTIQGKDDEMNTASLFAIFDLLEKAKPRIVTLEQTAGLIRRHPLFFNAVINMFTSRGFSVRWKVMNCADFGLPQRRIRLFIIASCPGEALPPFPSPSHSSKPEKTGLKPWTTINEAITNIPFGWPNHDIQSAIERGNSPQSGDKIATCITTSGGGIIHPSGKRDYTHREFACLQSFPLGHKFGASGVKKQIGNAVPPTMATILLETIIEALSKADGLL
ncbi:hypothetical protein BDR22DRAFT_927491 [Usnea florida]